MSFGVKMLNYIFIGTVLKDFGSKQNVLGSTFPKDPINSTFLNKGPQVKTENEKYNYIEVTR